MDSKDTKKPSVANIKCIKYYNWICFIRKWLCSIVLFTPTFLCVKPWEEAWERKPEETSGDIRKCWLPTSGWCFLLTENWLQAIKSTTQIWVVTHPSSVKNFCNRSSGVISWWNQWWCQEILATHIWVVLLTGWKFASSNQKHYADLGSDESSV